MNRKKERCSIVVFAILMTVWLSACGAKPVVDFDVTSVPRSIYNPEKEIITNDYFGFNLTLQSD